MTNDTNTLNGALTELGEVMAENLTLKGIESDASEGLTTLANKIKDITFDLTASITLTASANEVLLNQPVDFSASLINVNNDPIVNAVIYFKTSNDDLIGSAVTDENGVATYTHIIDTFGSIDVQAEFAGLLTCTSQIVTVDCNYDLNLTSDKTILSYKDNESCTITGVLKDSTGSFVENETINYEMLHDDIVLTSGSLVTDENGEISIDYDSAGVGDVDVIFSLRSILQKTYELEDCKYWNDNEVSISGSYNHTLYDSNLSVSLPTNAEISFDTTTIYISGDKDYRWWFFPKSQFKNNTVGPNNALYFDKKTSYILYNQRVDGSNKYSSSKRFSGKEYANIKYIKNGTSVKIYVDDVFMFEDTVSWIDNYTDYTISMMKWTGSEVIKMKNVKIKAL